MWKHKSLFRCILGIVAFSILTVVFFMLENHTDSLNLGSMIDALWYAVATFLGIGYADITQLTLCGKLVDICIILLGICFLGVIIGKITHAFTQQFEKRKLGYMGTKFEDHVIIIGWNSFSNDVAVQLLNADQKIAVLTDQKEDVEMIYQNFDHKNMFVYFTNLNNYEALNSLNIQKSKTVLINFGNDSDKLIAILNIKKLYENTQFVVLLDNADLKETFFSAGVTYVLSKDEIVSRMLASYIFEPAVADFTSDLITSAAHDESSDYDIQQYRVKNGNPYLQSKFGDMFYDLKKQYNIIAIGLNKTKKNGKKLIKIPKDDETIELNDEVLVIANGHTEIVMHELFNVCEGI